MKHFSESEVTIESVTNVFESAFIKVIEKSSESFKVQGENLKTNITIDEERKYLSMSILYVLSGNISLSEATLLANKVNEEYIVIRFSAIEHEGSIIMESKYYMTYEEGLIAFQLINMVKKFEKFTVDALREHYNDHL